MNHISDIPEQTKLDMLLDAHKRGVPMHEAYRDFLERRATRESVLAGSPQAPEENTP